MFVGAECTRAECRLHAREGGELTMHLGQVIGDQAACTVTYHAGTLLCRHMPVQTKAVISRLPKRWYVSCDAAYFVQLSVVACLIRDAGASER